VRQLCAVTRKDSGRAEPPVDFDGLRAAVTNTVGRRTQSGLPPGARSVGGGEGFEPSSDPEARSDFRDPHKATMTRGAAVGRSHVVRFVLHPEAALVRIEWNPRYVVNCGNENPRLAGISRRIWDSNPLPGKGWNQATLRLQGSDRSR
jgi:hypothetical protein